MFRISIFILSFNLCNSILKSSIRKLGGYERLLSRIAPGKDSVSLSHGCVALLNYNEDNIAYDDLLDSISRCIDKHPMLGVYIDKSSNDIKEQYFNKCEIEGIGSTTSSLDLANEVLEVQNMESLEFENNWKESLENAINGAIFPTNGPQWKMKCINVVEKKEMAWIFTFNHGIDDQQSVNILISDLIKEYVTYNTSPLDVKPFPPSIEDAISPELPGLNTLKWSLFQLGNSASGAKQIPNNVIDLKDSSPDMYKKYKDPESRRTIIQTFDLDPEQLTTLRTACKERGLTVTHALAAAMLFVTERVIHDESDNDIGSNNSKRSSVLRFLLSVGLRPFGLKGVSDFTDGTVACAGGAVDFVVRVPNVNPSFYQSHDSIIDNNNDNSNTDKETFWRVAKECKLQAADVFSTQNGFVKESVRLFGLGMQYAEILPMVEADAASDTLGRGYSCGVSNVGLTKYASTSTASNSSRSIVVDKVYYATSHARNGVLCQLSVESPLAEQCENEEPKLCGCLQFPEPLITQKQSQAVKNALLNILKNI